MGRENGEEEREEGEWEEKMEGEQGEWEEWRGGTRANGKREWRGGEGKRANGRREWRGGEGRGRIGGGNREEEREEGE